jgi:hypothetical protein
MSRAGWVHRDISSGNLYHYQGGGKIGDLEFAKQFVNEGSHEFRTVRRLKTSFFYMMTRTVRSGHLRLHGH